jgi:hypothetical protein
VSALLLVGLLLAGHFLNSAFALRRRRLLVFRAAVAGGSSPILLDKRMPVSPQIHQPVKSQKLW